MEQKLSDLVQTLPEFRQNDLITQTAVLLGIRLVERLVEATERIANALEESNAYS